MSKPTDRGSSSSSSNNNHTVAPTFFGSPSLYQSTPTKKKNNDESLVASPPKAENPYWNDINNPPPPYSLAPNQPISPHSSSFSADPSAPPLEPPTNYSQNSGYSQPQQPQSPQSPQQPQQYPPFGYHHYGTVPQQYPPNNNTTSDANIPTWPWIAPPSTAGQPMLVYQPSPPSGEYENYSAPPAKKQKSCCEISVQYFFYFFCICLVLRLIDLLSGGVNFAGSCSHGVVWEALPKKFEYGSSLIIRIAGGHLSGGHIVLKNIDEMVEAEDGAMKEGTVYPTALISPASLAHNSDLSFTLTRLMNGTVMEIYVPQGLSSSACVSLNAVIYVADNTEYVNIEVQNARIEVSDSRLDSKEISLATTNQAIEFNPSWEGTNLQLTTKNAHVEISKPIVSSNVVLVSTTNGGIRARHAIKAADTIYFETTNAGIDVDDTVESGNTVSLLTSNGHVNAHNITSRAVKVKTSNGRIQLDHANIIDLYNVQTTNSPLFLRLNSGYKAEVLARTSNSGVTAFLPSNYEAHFEVDTSSYSKIELVDPLGWAHIDSLGKAHVAGTRLAPGRDRNDRTNVGHLQVATSNANAHVHFGQ